LFEYLLFIDFNLLSIEINLLSIDFKLLSNDFQLNSFTQRKVEKVFAFFSTPKVVGHNRVPSKHSYY